MSSSLSIAPVRNWALIAAATFILLMSLALVPHQAHAAALTVTAATTTSNNASTTLAKSGNTFSFGLQLSGTPVATSTPVINIQGMGTSTMTGTGAFWTYSTTTSSSWNNGAVQFLFAYGDSSPGAGATTTKSQANLTGSNVTFDKSVPTISSLTSNATSAGVLKVGDTIVFTLTPGATEYGASVLGQYNGHTLSFSSSDAGVTFAGTYTVIEGDSDQSTALQLSASITDAAGNLSATTTGSDVVKTIDANSPTVVPTADPVAGSYSSAKSVTLTAAGSASIHYTTDGTTPSCSTSPAFQFSVNITSTATLKAVACDSAGNASSAGSFAYTISSGSHHGGGGGGGSSSSSHGYVPPVSVPPVTTTPGPGSTITSFVRSLQVGATGDDVKALQVWLNAHGFVVASTGPGSAGMETSTFGGLTKAAVAKFQAAHNLPSAGFFGPLTRAAIAAM